MALKYKIAKLEDVPEAVRGEYKKAPDGEEGFVLDVGGVVPKERLDEFRTNNINLSRALEALKDVDPAKYRELRKLEEDVEAGKLVAAGKVEEAVALRVKSMKDDLEGKLTTTNTALDTANRQLSGLLIDNNVKSAAIKAGVLPTAVDDVIHRARGVYVVENGSPVPKENGQVVFGKDGKTPMPPDEWIVGLKEKAPHLFQGTQGSGAGGGNRSGGKSTDNMSAVDKINLGLRQSGMLSDLPGANVGS